MSDGPRRAFCARPPHSVSPRPQPLTITLSPGFHRVTPGPTWTTVPENSWPKVTGALTPVSGWADVGINVGAAKYSCRSVPQMPL